MRKTIVPVLAIWTFLLIANAASAGMSEKVKLVGQIIGYEEKTVSFRSGNRVFTFLKSELKYPNYNIGDTLEVEVSKDKMSKLKSKQAK